MLNYVMSSKVIRDELQNVDSALFRYENILHKKLQLLGHRPDDDLLFRLLAQTRLVDESGAHRTCVELAGNYNVLLNRSQEVARLYIVVERFDPYSKAPKFVAYSKFKDDVLFVSEGVVLDINGKFILSGVTRSVIGNNRTAFCSGIFVMALNHGIYSRSRNYRGTAFFAGNDGEYELSSCRMIHTTERYSEKKIGMFSKERIPDSDL